MTWNILLQFLSWAQKAKTIWASNNRQPLPTPATVPSPITPYSPTSLSPNEISPNTWKRGQPRPHSGARPVGVPSHLYKTRRAAAARP